MASIKKRIKLTIKEGSNLILVSNDLRVDFEVEQTIGEALNIASFKIYNLNRETITLLAADKDFKVTLEVGAAHSKELSVLFKGDLINIHSSPMFEDVITTLYCWERGMDAANSFCTDVKTYKNTKLTVIVDELRNNMKDELGQVYEVNYDLATRQNVVVNNFCSDRTHLKTLVSLLKQYNMVMTVRNGTIWISDSINKEDSTDKLAANKNVTILDIRPELLKKPVQFSIVEAEVAYELTPSIKPLDLIRLKDSNIQSQLSGYDPVTLKLVKGITNILPRTHYFLTKVIHTGSLYSDEWSTTLTGIVYTKIR